MSRSEVGTDFLVVTALEEEQDAVLSQLPDHQRLPPQAESVLTYYAARLPIARPDAGDARYTLVVTYLVGMGRVEAATATADAIRTFNPRYVLLVGIAGGVAARGVRLGDVLLADQIVDYSLEKATPAGPEYRFKGYPVDRRLLAAAHNLQVQDFATLIAETRPSPGGPTLYIGPVASGDKKVADERRLDQLRQHWPQLIGVEMEAGGAALAAHHADPGPGFFMIRGVSDLADQAESKPRVRKWRGYACHVAAAYAVALLRSGPVLWELSEETAAPREGGPAIPLQRPPRDRFFLGRGEELEQLLKDLRPGEVVTLCGPGGMGKSALAIQAIWALAPAGEPPERFPDGVVFYSFYGRPDAALACEHIVRSFDEQARDNSEDAVRRLLSRKRALLVLDGAEQADDLPRLLELRGGCGVLVTSRSTRDAPAGWQNVPPLPRTEGVELLRAWGGEYAGDQPAAEQVCGLVGGLPLAVRLIGFHLARDRQPVAHCLQALQASPLKTLDRGRRQQDSVPLLLERSVAQLGAEAGRALACAGFLALASFDGAVVAAGLKMSVPAAEQALGELLSYGLLDEREGRYRLAHPLIHAYCRERMPAEAEEAARMAAFLDGFARAQRPEGMEGFRRLDAERPHLMAALAGCAERGRWEAVRGVVWAVEDYLDLQGHWTERLTALQIGVMAARALHQRRDEGAFLGNLGIAYHGMGRVERAIEHYQAALAISREIGDRRGEGQDLGNLGLSYHDLGQAERAIEQYQAALEIAREIGDRRGEGNQLGNLGIAYHDLGQVERAIEHHQAALAISREIGDRRGEGNSLGNLGLAYLDLGQVERAIEFHQAALVIAREIGDRRGEGADLANLGRAYHTLGQMEQARACWMQALSIFEEVKSPDAEKVRRWLEGLDGDERGQD